ncbi:MAG: hypothetical protein CMJ78_18860 [Planctomycetaceae bacterium]|nr:hypothetical protein [Planctomycetaceae bacterium]
MRHNRDTGRAAVSIFATAFVMTIGLMVCLSIILSAAQDPQVPLMVCCGIFVGTAVLLSLLRLRPSENGEFWLFELFKNRTPFDRGDLEAGKKKKPKIKTYGTNEPPSADSVRKIKRQLSTWDYEDGDGELKPVEREEE